MVFPTIDETHDPDLECWVDGAAGHPVFPVQNLPLGVFSCRDGHPRIGTAIGDFVLDLAALAGGLPIDGEVMRAPLLNPLLALPGSARSHLRKTVSTLLCDRDRARAVSSHLHPIADCRMHLPARIGDYSDFFVGIHHATNIGKLFRPDNPLLPNYKHVPIGYHGRASSIRPSGVPVRRPVGQRRRPGADLPIVGPTTRLDYELELGVWIGPGNTLGEPIAIADAAAHIAGYGLLNDWSARDFQAWEYVPLGPFLAKSFHSTVSPWIVTAEALAPFRALQPTRPADDPRPLPYLWAEDDQAHGALALDLEVFLSTAAMRETGIDPQRLSIGPATSMYWTPQQIVAHHTSNGCNLSPGDLLGTGTISTPEPSGYGSLMELSGGGAFGIALPGGVTRTFLEDGDEVLLRATARAPGFVPIGFGECRAVIEPAS